MVRSMLLLCQGPQDAYKYESWGIRGHPNQLDASLYWYLLSGPSPELIHRPCGRRTHTHTQRRFIRESAYRIDTPSIILKAYQGFLG